VLALARTRWKKAGLVPITLQEAAVWRDRLARDRSTAVQVHATCG